jgi:hypothetical protein
MDDGKRKNVGDFIRDIPRSEPHRIELLSVRVLPLRQENTSYTRYEVTPVKNRHNYNASTSLNFTLTLEYFKAFTQKSIS